MKSFLIAVLLVAGLASLRPGQSAPSKSAPASAQPSAALEPDHLDVDWRPVAGTSSNFNGVLEPGETIQISPFWMNTQVAGQAFMGTASGPGGPAGTVFTIGDSLADYGTVSAGATKDCNSATGDCYVMTVSNPVSRPAAHWDATFTETLTVGAIANLWKVHVGTSFADVPTSHQFYFYIEQLFHSGVTAGCGGPNYCPGASVTRAQMAVFLLKTKFGADYVPQDCATNPEAFGDVTCPSLYADWIEQLAAEGITAGCGGGNYCPDASVTRDQMAVFLLKTKHGSAYVPPSCVLNPTFVDVPCPSLFADWIGQLAAEGITGGCGNGNYCPGNPVTRGQMAVFLDKTAGLPAPPPSTPTPTPTKTPIPAVTPTPQPNHVVFVGQGGNNFVDSVSGTSTTTIHVGETVEWQWVAGSHSTTSGPCPPCNPSGLWNSGTTGVAGFSFPHTFPAQGTIPYYCIPHGAEMTGQVIVTP
jgi:plastocyanin